MDQLRDWIKKLKDKGIRCTRQRLAILEVLVNSEKPLSAQELFSKLESDNPKLRLSTIYRNLNQFEAHNLVRKFNFDSNKSKFELAADKPHHHLICLNCGAITPLDCPFNNFEEELGIETDYTVLDHKMKVYGLCPECKEE